MKIKTLGALNIIIGILQIVFLLLQNGTIQIKAFIDNYRYTDAFYSFMTVFMIILSILILILLVFTIISHKKRKEQNTKNIGYNLIFIGHVISLFCFVFWGCATILSPLCVIGGIILLKSN